MGILQARILEWVAMPFSRGSSQPRDQTQVTHIAGGFFTIWATREALSWAGVGSSSYSSQQERGKTIPLSWKILPGSHIDHFEIHAMIQSLTTWPHIALEEDGKCCLYSKCRVLFLRSKERIDSGSQLDSLSYQKLRWGRVRLLLSG